MRLDDEEMDLMASKLTAEQLHLFSEVADNKPGLSPEEIKGRCDLFSDLVAQELVDKEDPLYSKMLMAGARIKAMFGDFAGSMIILEEILKMALAEGNQTWINKTRNNMALVTQYQGDIFSAIDIWESLLTADLDLTDRIIYINNLGVAYFRAGKNTKAIESYLLALDLLENEDRPSDRADVFNNLGNSYRESGFKEEALNYYNSALKLYEIAQNHEKLGSIYNNMCIQYFEMSDALMAEKYGKLALEYYQKYDTPRMLCVALNNYANSKLLAQKHEEAKELYHQAYNAALDSNHIEIQISSLNNLSLLALQQDEPDKAIDYAESALKLAKQYKLVNDAKVSYVTLKEAWAHKGEYKRAYEAIDKLIEIGELHAKTNPKLEVALAESEFLQKKLDKQLQIVSEKTFELETNNNLFLATNALLKRIISVIAHDVRGPVATIAQTLDLFEGDLFSAQDKEEMILELSKSARLTSNLITELLQIAQKYKSGVDEEAELFEITQAVISSMAVVETTAKAKYIDIKYISSMNSLNVYMNKGRLNLIVRNLLSNAIKFSHANSQITVELKRSKDVVTLAITDQGVGMTGKQIKSIMSGASFTQLGTNSEKGFGMGLVFVLESILYTKGQLDIKSTPGKGTSFIIDYNWKDIKPRT